MKLYSPFQFPAMDGLVKNLKIEMYDDDPTAKIPSGCENGWTHHSLGRTCYRFFSSKVTWDEARRYCQNLKAELASVTSFKTNEFLTTLTQEECWIGGYKNGSTWQWTDGSESIWWKYRNWASGQPDNIGGNQDKLQFNFKEPGKWGDEESHKQQPFICQKHLGILELLWN